MAVATVFWHGVSGSRMCVLPLREFLEAFCRAWLAVRAGGRKERGCACGARAAGSEQSPGAAAGAGVARERGGFSLLPARPGVLGPGRALSSARTGTLSPRSTGGTGAVPAFHRRYQGCARVPGLLPALSPRPWVATGAVPASQDWYRRCPRVPASVPALSAAPAPGLGGAGRGQPPQGAGHR